MKVKERDERRMEKEKEEEKEKTTNHKSGQVNKVNTIMAYSQ